MKRFLVVVLVLLIAVGSFSALFAGGAAETAKEGASAFEKRTLRFGTTSAENTLVVAAMREFAQKVLDRTDGQVTIQIFPASQLGDAVEIVKSAQMGAVDICMAQPASIAGMGVNSLGVLSLPYLFTSFDQRLNVLMGDIGKDLLGEITNSSVNLVGLGYFPDGARNFFTAKGKPIRKIEDVRNMKLRVQPYALDTDMVLAMGGSPTPTAFAELYSAMQTGVVDGGEQPIAGFYGGKFHEVSQYFILDEHTYNTLLVIFSKLSWNKLSPELQEVIQVAWNESVDEFSGKVIEAEADMLKQIEAEGVEVIHLTDGQKWVAAMDPVYAKHGVGLEQWIERIKAVK